MALTADDKKWIAAEIRAAVKAELRAGMPDVPTATENADAVWRKTRSDPRPPWSDTARNLLGAEITEAVQAGVAIERYPFNEGK